VVRVSWICDQCEKCSSVVLKKENKEVDADYVHLYANTLPYNLYTRTRILSSPLPSLCLRSFDNKERPRMLLDSRLAFHQIILTQLSDVRNNSIRFLERVLLISDVHLTQDTIVDSQPQPNRQSTSRAPRLS